MSRVEELAEIREADATGVTADIFTRIRGTLGVPIVNFFWRHLATIDGGLEWAWPIVEAAAPQIDGWANQVLALADDARAGLGSRPIRVSEPEIPAILAVYNRANPWNCAALALLTARRSGTGVGAFSRVTPAAAVPDMPKAVATMPRFDALADATRATVELLAAAGPARDSGIRPSLWVHFGHWPEDLRRVAGHVVPVLEGPAFARSYRALRLSLFEGSDGDGLAPAPHPDPIDDAIARFSRRICEMILIGRYLEESIAGASP